MPRVKFRWLSLNKPRPLGPTSIYFDEIFTKKGCLTQSTPIVTRSFGPTESRLSRNSFGASAPLQRWVER